MAPIFERFKIAGIIPVSELPDDLTTMRDTHERVQESIDPLVFKYLPRDYRPMIREAVHAKLNIDVSQQQLIVEVAKTYPSRANLDANASAPH